MHILYILAENKCQYLLVFVILTERKNKNRTEGKKIVLPFYYCSKLEEKHNENKLNTV